MKENQFGDLTKLLTAFHKSDVPIFPIRCLKCGSLQMTVVFGTKRTLECLDCGAISIIYSTHGRVLRNEGH